MKVLKSSLVLTESCGGFFQYFAQPALLCRRRMEAGIRAWPVSFARTAALFISLSGAVQRFPGRDLAAVPARGVGEESARQVPASPGRRTCPANPLRVQIHTALNSASIREAEQHPRAALPSCAVRTQHCEVSSEGLEPSGESPPVAKATLGAKPGPVPPYSFSSQGCAASSSAPGPWCSARGCGGSEDAC